MTVTPWLSITAIPIILKVVNTMGSFGKWLNDWAKRNYAPMRNCITGSLETLETMDENNDGEASRKEFIVGTSKNIANSRYASTATDEELIARFTALLKRYPKK